MDDDRPFDIDAGNPASGPHVSAECPAGRKISGVQGGPHLSPLGLFLRTSIPFTWRILGAFLPS